MVKTFKTYGETVEYLLANPKAKARTSYADRVFDYDSALIALGAAGAVARGLGEVYARRRLGLDGEAKERWLKKVTSNKVSRAPEATDQNA